ncbi:MAG: hypothetical protein CMJ46_05855, partial [Planctomyces sp.]|nr:hypothetical protein [Planctomyces sp.]
MPPLTDHADPAEHLVLFARYPEPGKTKTRLHSAFQPHEAAAIAHYLLRHTINIATELADARKCGLTLFF